MPSPLGEFLTRWTIRLALACYVAYVAGEFVLPRLATPKQRRWVWTLGCVLFDVHVACAFHFFHHWSHSAAWHSTAERTAELLGVAAGNGIFFSYAFLVLWWLDVIWLWRNSTAASGPREGHAAEAVEPTPTHAGASDVPRQSLRSLGQPRWRRALHLFLFFIALNGAVVFETGPTRWVGIAVCVVFGSLFISRAYNGLVNFETPRP